MPRWPKTACDNKQLLKLSAGIVVGVAAARCLWKYLQAEKTQPSTGSSRKRTVSDVVQNKGLGPEEGLWIYFGSQSGTAQGFAEELEQDAAGHGVPCGVNVVDLEDFEPEEFVKHKVVILVLATYGEGDPTDNSVDFFKYLQDKSLGSDTITDMKFTVMGLGNRQYVNYNSCGKIADASMERLGALRIYDRGEGDDDQDIGQDFEMWKEGLWPALQQVLGSTGDPDAVTAGAAATPEEVVAKLPLRAVVYTAGAVPPTDPLVQMGGSDVLGKWYFNAVKAPVSVTDELRQASRPEEGKTTKHMEFDVSRLQAVNWQTADNLEVLPTNPACIVDWFVSRLGVQDQIDSLVTFVRASGVDKTVKKPFPTPCAVRVALADFCDLCAAPTRAAAKRLAGLIVDEVDRAALEKLLDDREAYHWATGGSVRMTLQEFFSLYMQSADINVSIFLQLCPRQKSRPYTISSSRRENAKRIGVCVSMVQEQLISLQELLDGLVERGHGVPSQRAATCLQGLGEDGAVRPRIFAGLCSEMLTRQSARGDKLWVFARASSFRLPRRTTTPIIMICAGTGIAPMRAFVREFIAEGGVRTKTLLFFGCTKKDDDFLYRDELQEALSMSPPALGELVTAFSREQDHKIYVQHRLKERAEDVVKLIGDGAYIFVCGAASMGASVRETLAEALGSPDHVSRLQVEGRFVEELW